ncbi:GNAT family N-acetyltransferase [Candidatus Uabimicrobium amorphum]|uniref:N-acetyltransferase GCN5 n=1 Tax=Uabimicrobium amorphum TaxID=2596890 RepID=A0A5S9F0U2_UABAM|nr:GNAT family N-acetyltransferase [Candidatus Uabimicrobium amorphum]BBM81937.1 N-acetyltransferase GCN5 [Candidatus Uabimicrobium amorphum]
MQIRKAQPQDCEAIVFGNCAMALETENKKLDKKRVTKGVKALLNDESKGFYIVAEENGEVIGQLMITYEWSDWRNGTFWWIQSVYIAKEHRRKGVYTRLYAYIREKCQEHNVCGIRLYVDKNNVNARQTYEKLGMEFSHYDFMEEDFVL